MNFLNMVKNAPTEGRIKLKGGQSQGYVEKPSEKICIEKYTPSLLKGPEHYLPEYKVKAEKEYLKPHMVTNAHQKTNLRVDVTAEAGGSQMLEVDDLTSTGTVPNLRELNREELTQVYQQYSFMPLEPSEHLRPIYNKSEKIVRLIEMNPVCIIKGPTGCGKSTQIPQFILDSYVKLSAHCNIIVTQPRRMAAITLAQHVCEQRNWEVGGLVGYQVALDKKSSENTRLLYCTTGVLLEKLIAAKNMTEYTHIFLDEVHEREEDMDFVMLIIKGFLRTNSPQVKVVLMSATIDVTTFTKYFEVNLPKGISEPAPCYEIQRDSKFNVQVYYLDNLKSLGELPEININEPKIDTKTYKFVPMMIRAFNAIDDDDFKHKRCASERGAVLIFLPGLYQIETLFEILQREDKENTCFKFWLCPLHSSITRDEQEKVRIYAPPGKRKIILSTNIAESSLTIPDVKYVIDFCLTKHLVCDTETGLRSLQLAWASHTNCMQREGRVGRVQDGRVYRLVPQSFYLYSMPKKCVPEMQRCPLEIIVLKCKKLVETACPLYLISTALDPPDLSNYEKTILKLKEVGALLTTCRGEATKKDGDMTFMGVVMAALPLDVHISKLILLGHIFDVLEEAIIMGCAMSVQNIFSEPFGERLKAYNSKLIWADSSESDSIAFLNTYTVWRQLKGIGRFKRSVCNEETWARQYMIQMKHLREVVRLEEDIQKRLKSLNIEVVRPTGKPLWNPQEKPLILKLVLAGAFYPHYFSCKPQNPLIEYEAVKTLAGHDPLSSVYLQNMPHPAPVYYDVVKKELKKKAVSEDVTLHHDDTRKLIVTFNSKKSETRVQGERNMSSDIPGNINMAVYRAVKLRQLNEPISIKTMLASEVKEELNKLSLCSQGSMMSLASALPENRQTISLNQEYIEIEVTHVENAGRFFGHIQLYDIKAKVHRVQHILNKSKALSSVNGDIVNDVIYAAPYRENNDEDLLYYRAKVKKVNKSDVDVFFIDFGNSEKIPTTDLREIVSDELQRELNDIPACALEFVLAEVSPSVWTSHEGQWSDEANKYVAELLMSRIIFLTKVYSFVNGVASVFLYLRDNDGPANEAPLTLNTELVRRDYARHKEESYLSKLNHAKRIEVQERGEYHVTSPSLDDSESISRSFRSFDLHCLPTNSSVRPIQLKGPNSPLEMKLFSLVHCSTHKEVKVEWNSVNSVLLDSDPSDRHERILVAGSVSQSPDRRKLTLNHTTVLPNMHGLASLICLIFSPSVEIRTDYNYSRFTGALCGLGMDDEGNSLFPENDIETVFDVEFSFEDLVNVNKLRFWLNHRFCSENNDHLMADRDVINILKNIKMLTCTLLKNVRPSVKINLNSNSHKWGLVKEEDCLAPLPENFDLHSLNKSRIYKLFSAADIQAKHDKKEIEDLVKKLKTVEEKVASGFNLDNRQMYCNLCDIHFDYWNQVKLHMAVNNHHKDLVRWLESRARAHGIAFQRQAHAN